MTSESGGLVAAGNKFTAGAAASVLSAGGNAFDAMVAALWAATVCEPVLCSLGGGGFLTACKAGQSPEVLDFFCDTPLIKLPANAVDFEEISADFGTVQQSFHTGRGSVATPGFVAGLFAMHERYCTVPMSELVKPAIDLASKGHALDPFQAYILGVVKPIMMGSAESARLYQSRQQGFKGQTMQAGETFKNLDLANAIERLGVEGPGLFYEGELAQIIAHEQSERGMLTLDDLRTYKIHIRNPVQANVNGATLFTNPVPSSGGTMLALQLELLGQADAGDLKERRHWTLALAQAMGTANFARHESGFAKTPAKASAKRLFDLRHIEKFKTDLAARAEKIGGTTHVSIVDASGNVAATTVSNGEGSGDVIPGTGIMLNNMLGEEDINPNGFFNWDCGTRISSMMAPSILARSDGQKSALGSGGSNRIRTALFQVVAEMTIRKASEAEAVANPRVHFEKDLLHIEGGFDRTTLKALRQAFPNHQVWDDKNLFFGGVHVATTGQDGFAGAADERRGGTVVKV